MKLANQAKAKHHVELMETCKRMGLMKLALINAIRSYDDQFPNMPVTPAYWKLTITN